MSLTLRRGIYWYDFIRQGVRHQGSTHTGERQKAEAVQRKAKQNAGFPSEQVERELVDPGVYFLKSEATGLTKVGCSGDLGERIRGIQGGSGEELRLIAKIPAREYRAAEKHIHKVLQKKRSRAEWFNLSLPDIEIAIRSWFTAGWKEIDGE